MFYTIDEYGVKFSEDKTELIKAPEELSGKYNIPNTVTSISASAFSYCNKVEEIFIPDSVVTIGASAFENCTSLVSVHLPNKLQTISVILFYRCIKLRSITIPESVIEIGHSAFCKCESLCSITIPDSVKEIGECIFDDCKLLSQVTLSSKINSIPYGMFSRCSMLESIHIPDNVNSIGEQAFYECSILRSVFVGDQLQKIDNSAFLGCARLRSFYFGKGIESIGERIFYGCSKLDTIEWNVINYPDYDYAHSLLGAGGDDYGNKRSICYYISHFKFGPDVKHIPANLCCYLSIDEINIPNNVESIGYGAFKDCNPTYIYLNKNITPLILYEMFGDPSEEEAARLFFKKNTFRSCIKYHRKDGNDFWLNSIDEFEVSPENQFFSAHDNCLYNKDGTKLIKIGNYCSASVFDGVKEIEDFACQHSGIKEVVLKDCNRIGGFAFEDCKELRKIVFGKDYKSHGDFAFIDCSKLSEIEWHANEGYLILSGFREVWGTLDGERCRYGHLKEDLRNQIDTVVLGDELTTLPEFLTELFEIVKLDIPNSITDLSSALPPYLTKLTINHKQILSDDCLGKNFSYENGFLLNADKTILYKYIGEETAIIVLNGVVEIADYAFKHSKVESIILPDSLRVIGQSCFANSQLTSITFNKGLKEIKSYAFKDCRYLNALSFSASVDTIGYGVYEGCSSLKEIFITTQVSLVGCNSLEKIIWADTSEECKSEKTFFNLRSFSYYYDDKNSVAHHIKDIEIVNGVQCLPKEFASYTKIKEIHIPGTVKSIGYKAFYNCCELEKIIIDSMDFEFEEDFCHFDSYRIVVNDHLMNCVPTIIYFNNEDVTEHFKKINQKKINKRMADEREQEAFDDLVRSGIETAFEGDPEAMWGIMD